MASSTNVPGTASSEGQARGRGAWAFALDHTHSPQIKGFGVHSALCQEDPDVVEPTVHDSEMKSCRGNPLTAQAQKHMQKTSTPPHPHKPPSKRESARAAIVHSYTILSSLHYPENESQIQPRKSLLSASIVIRRWKLIVAQGATLGF